MINIRTSEACVYVGNISEQLGGVYLLLNFKTLYYRPVPNDQSQHE